MSPDGLLDLLDLNHRFERCLTDPKGGPESRWFSAPRAVRRAFRAAHFASKILEKGELLPEGQVPEDWAGTITAPGRTASSLWP